MRTATLPRAEDRAAAGGLTWRAEHGVGFLPVAESPYDADYFAKYVGYAQTKMGRAITAERVGLVERWMPRGSVIDVGIGCGAFVEAMGERCYGCDINPAGVAWLNHRARFRAPQHGADALTFWDSIEHIPAADEMLAHARLWVFASLPIVPEGRTPGAWWKHYRPDEHCWYWTRRGFTRWMEGRGFALAEHSDVETKLGREDIETFAFRRTRSA